MATIQKLNLRMLELIKKHRELDTKIRRLQTQPGARDNELKSMKVRKLEMRTEIANISSQLDILHKQRNRNNETGVPLDDALKQINT
jgi:hypothetical protein